MHKIILAFVGRNGAVYTGLCAITGELPLVVGLGVEDVGVPAVRIHDGGDFPGRDLNQLQALQDAVLCDRPQCAARPMGSLLDVTRSSRLEAD